MPRLIDADSLKATLRKTLKIYQYRQDDFGQGKAVGLTDAMEAVDWAPTIDAIPVEWLEEHDSEGNEYGRRYITVVEALSTWQREQEAQDD